MLAPPLDEFQKSISEVTRVSHAERRYRPWVKCLQVV
jgi:hypothetical protein